MPDQVEQLSAAVALRDATLVVTRRRIDDAPRWLVNAADVILSQSYVRALELGIPPSGAARIVRDARQHAMIFHNQPTEG